mgnify:CR=1 FL=1
MGTLGCINDMLQRDKENQELRKRNRERLTDTYHRLLDSEKKYRPLSDDDRKDGRYPQENLGKRRTGQSLRLQNNALFSFRNDINSSLGMVACGV